MKSQKKGNNMKVLNKNKQLSVTGGTLYECQGCGYTFGYTGYRAWLWGGVESAKGMHEYVRHNNKKQTWKTK